MTKFHWLQFLKLEDLCDGELDVWVFDYWSNKISDLKTKKNHFVLWEIVLLFTIF